MDQYIEIAAFVGAVIGVLVGTLGPYYKKKRELGQTDIEIFFDRAFLKATFVALALAIVGVGGSFPTLLANVPPAGSIITTLIASAVFAMTMNLGGNILIGPSQVTQSATTDALNRKVNTIVENKLAVQNVGFGRLTKEDRTGLSE